MKRSVTVVTTAVLALGLAGLPACSSDKGGSASADSDTTIAVSTTAASEQRSVERTDGSEPQIEGAFNVAPTVKIPNADLDVGSSGVVIEGDGAVVGGTDRLVAQLGAYRLADAAVVGASWLDTVPVMFQLGGDAIAPAISDQLVGATVGSRIWLVTTAGETGGGGKAVGQTGGAARAEPGDKVVLVVDVLAAYGPASVVEGTAAAAPAGYPVYSDGEPPTVSAATVAAPAVAEVHELIAGAGPALELGQAVVVQYVMTEWDTGKTVDSTWASRGGPMFLTLGRGMLPVAVEYNLLGKPAGSRQLVVVPPSTDGTINFPPALGLDETKTYAVTFDILDVIDGA